MDALGELPLRGLLRGPREVLFGAGTRASVPAATARLGRRALVVTDPRLGADRATGQLVDGLRAAGLAVAVHDRAAPELPVEDGAALAEEARRHGADVLVGFGGGSCMDLAKVVAVLLAHGGTPQDYYGEDRVPGPVAPVVAVPTTAGTGSEVTPVAVVTDAERATKVGISSRHLVPHTAVVDPELAITCPPSVTAAAGADALAHCVEAFTAVRRRVDELDGARVFVGRGVLTDHWALLGVRHVARHLRRCVEVPDDLEARSGMALAALAGGMAFGTAGTAGAHAVQYPVGALTRTPHGTGVGLLLPYVMAFVAPVVGDRLREVAEALGVPEAQRTGPDAGSVRAVADLVAAIGIPRTLAELGVGADDLPALAAASMSARRLVENSPRELDEAAALRLLRAAHAGDLAVDGQEVGAASGDTEGAA
ncbi:iron-containing alcohol dehydrogenase [uncultured Pseudokineococcus sp.]|uniref:iron-containing alcohol dehydrogenase n=1 Tax=uncultured Pseudokineococcus sp. TaxID=1642928 RepID=UPI00260CD1CE|nr:iron-containing alcohol dehydrogenase [uncultured Pseudokineococcus sp.]